MSSDAPKTNLGIAIGATVAGGAAMLAMLSRGFSVMAYAALVPWVLGAIGLYHAVRAAMLDASQREDLEYRSQRAMHFSIFSLSITGIVVVIVLFLFSL